MMQQVSPRWRVFATASTSSGWASPAASIWSQLAQRIGGRGGSGKGSTATRNSTDGARDAAGTTRWASLAVETITALAPELSRM